VTSVLSIAAAVLGFSVLIVVHEAGHAWVARRLGMRVDRFSVGFGPVLWSFRRRGIEFCLSALPLGGYVKIAGMAPGEEIDPADPAAYCNQPAWRRFLAIAAGPTMNWLVAVLLAAALISTVGLRTADPASRVGELKPGWPAAEAGLQGGDRIDAVAGVPVRTWDELVAQIRLHPGERVSLAVVRGDGERARALALELTPRAEGGMGRAGFGPAILLEQRPLPAALGVAVVRTNQGLGQQLAGFVQVIQRRRASDLSGPVGIAQELFQGARSGTATFLTMLWGLSIALALLNLLPLPALDGGRLVFLVYEIVTRRRVNERVENVVHLAGFVALLALMLAVTVFGDLARFLKR